MEAVNLLEYLFGGKKRKNGDTVVSHFYAVRDILKEAGVDDEVTLNAALLHDVLEDTYCTRKYLEFSFGRKVADIVFFLSKSDKWLNSHSRAFSQFWDIGNIWRKHPEVVLVKIADRIHNLQTIDGFKLEKRREYLAETRNYLLPLFRLISEQVQSKIYSQIIERLILKLEGLLLNLENSLN